MVSLITKFRWIFWLLLEYLSWFSAATTHLALVFVAAKNRANYSNCVRNSKEKSSNVSYWANQICMEDPVILCKSFVWNHPMTLCPTIDIKWVQTFKFVESKMLQTFFYEGLFIRIILSYWPAPIMYLATLTKYLLRLVCMLKS